MTSRTVFNNNYTEKAYMKKRSLMMNLTIPDAMPSISITVKRKGTNDGEDKGTAENAAVINNIEYEGWKDEDNLEKVNQLSVAESVNQNFENGNQQEQRKQRHYYNSNNNINNGRYGNLENNTGMVNYFTAPFRPGSASSRQRRIRSAGRNRRRQYYNSLKNVKNK